MKHFHMFQLPVLNTVTQCFAPVHWPAFQKSKCLTEITCFSPELTADLNPDRFLNFLNRRPESLDVFNEWELLVSSLVLVLLLCRTGRFCDHRLTRPSVWCHCYQTQKCSNWIQRWRLWITCFLDAATVPAAESEVQETWCFLLLLIRLAVTVFFSNPSWSPLIPGFCWRGPTALFTVTERWT